MTWDARRLNDGTIIPGIAFGTAYTSKADLEVRILQAINAGFRHFDTAEAYDNEKELGEALRRSGIPRSELFISTKWSNYEEGGPLEACQRSLQILGVDHVDLYLIHQSRNCRGDIPGTWKQLEEIKRRGMAKSIGVSNFDLESFQVLLSSCSTPPAVNQIYLSPNNFRAVSPILHSARAHNVVIEAYWLLRSLTDDFAQPLAVTARDVAQARGCQADQVLLAWAKTKGVIPITSSSSSARLAGYIQAGTMELADGEVTALEVAGSKASGTLPWAKA